MLTCVGRETEGLVCHHLGLDTASQNGTSMLREDALNCQILETQNGLLLCCRDHVLPELVGPIQQEEPYAWLSEGILPVYGWPSRWLEQRPKWV